MNGQSACNFKTAVTFSLYNLLLIPLFLVPQNSNATIISELYITEVMANPAAVSDSYGEWFELYNPTAEVFDLNGIMLTDNGSNSHIISDTSPLLINPGDYFVLGINGNTTLNGGVELDYDYSGFYLGNSDDEIILSDSLGNQLILEYLAGFVANGQSSELISPDMAADNYTTTTMFSYGAGDKGTPGSNGSYEFTAASVPEPATFWLFMAGFVGLLSARMKNSITKFQVFHDSSKCPG